MSINYHTSRTASGVSFEERAEVMMGHKTPADREKGAALMTKEDLELHSFLVTLDLHLLWRTGSFLHETTM